MGSAISLWQSRSATISPAHARELASGEPFGRLGSAFQGGRGLSCRNRSRSRKRGRRRGSAAHVLRLIHRFLWSRTNEQSSFEIADSLTKGGANGHQEKKEERCKKGTVKKEERWEEAQEDQSSRRGGQKAPLI